MEVDDVTPVNGSEGVIMPNGLARPGTNAPISVQAMVDAGDRITSLAYSYGGGHCAAAMNQTVPDPDACPGEQENGGPRLLTAARQRRTSCGAADTRVS